MRPRTQEFEEDDGVDEISISRTIAEFLDPIRGNQHRKYGFDMVLMPERFGHFHGAATRNDEPNRLIAFLSQVFLNGSSDNSNNINSESNIR